MEWITDPQLWVALATLTALEIVLGVDNIIFISILCGRLPEHQRAKARTIGLMLAMLTRIALLFTLSWFMTLTEPLLTIFSKAISWRDLILIGGGLFLLWKSVHEIHNSLEYNDARDTDTAIVTTASFGAIIAQIAIIDIVFSLDSVITAVGMVNELSIMVIAIVIAVSVMLFAAGPIGNFVDRHPTIKMLALAFLILVGFALIGEGWDLHIPKGYIYFAMAFSVAVEILNLRMRANRRTVELNKSLPK
ncbi:TerC family protein [Nitrosomonas sp.]|uniref:TerC family protein n=1 Tax=Nitrosomonas sp. TaxID=42353 RepID=UPI002631139D|nr:TerC family protein [Nitrosomonas sp.]MCW5602077.1 TerC family protein [Nitrosomonas sp.]